MVPNFLTCSSTKYIDVVIAASKVAPSHFFFKFYAWMQLIVGSFNPEQLIVLSFLVFVFSFLRKTGNLPILTTFKIPIFPRNVLLPSGSLYEHFVFVCNGITCSFSCVTMSLSYVTSRPGQPRSRPTFLFSALLLINRSLVFF